MVKKTVKTRLLATPPSIKEAPRHIHHAGEDSIQDLNFKVSTQFHRDFKIAAVSNGMSMKELLEEAFRVWSAQKRR